MNNKGCHHYLLQPQFPVQTFKTVKDIVTLHLQDSDSMVMDKRHKKTDGHILTGLNLEPGQRAICKSIRFEWCANETNVPFTMRLEDLFVSHNVPFESEHPDSAGLVEFVVPPAHEGPIFDSCIYRPAADDLGCKPFRFAGMEDSIMEARSSHVGSVFADFEVFQLSDPIMIFILENRDKLPEVEIEPFGDTGYAVNRDGIASIRKLFQDAIFPFFCYANPRGPRLLWTQDSIYRGEEFDKEIVLEFVAEYLIVSRGIPKIPVKDTRVLIKRK